MLTKFQCDFTKEPISFENCVKCASEGRNVCRQKYGILLIIKNEAETRLKREADIEKRRAKAKRLLDKATPQFREKHPQIIKDLEYILKPHYSVSKLIAPCHRRTILEYKFEYMQNPKNLWWLTRGTLIHNIVEQVKELDKEIMTEIPIEIDRGDYILTCRVDMVNPRSHILTDFKTTNSMWKTFKDGFSPLFRDYHQVNINRFYWNHTHPDIPIHKLELTYLDLKFHNTLQCPIATRDTVVKFIKKGLRVLRPTFEEGYLPPRRPDYPNSFWCKDYCPVRGLCDSFEGDDLNKYLKGGIKNE